MNLKDFAVSSLVAAALAAGCSSSTRTLPYAGPSLDAVRARSSGAYRIEILASLGGTNSAANALNDRGWATGTSFLSGNTTMHAALWKGHAPPIDLKTLGGPNSAVEWPIESERGYVAGISETATPDPLGESKQWSCHAFLPDGGSSGDTCLGFVWRDGTMKPLPTLGGNNGYAAGTNKGDVVAGWAETSAKDSTCVAPQQLQFLPVTWNAGTLAVHQLPTLTAGGKTDPDGAATAANDMGEVVGISGICDQAVGRFTAHHAVVWQNGKVAPLQTFGARSWNTPTAINDRGQIAGFLNRPGAKDRKGGVSWVSVIWQSASAAPTKIGFLHGDTVSEPTSINDSGVVLGVSFPSSHVWIWRNGKLTDVTKLALASDPSVQLLSVGGIDARGEIAGQACVLVKGACPASNATLVTFLAIPH
ncbi:MAG TPA: hypothetical protein VMF61_14460 [Candidatus Acidoferrales bacterium]|nr:hypothetical protein [Candidatus Acidoferrales bacterium]